MANLEKTAFLFLMFAVALLRLHGLSWLRKLPRRSASPKASNYPRNRILPQHVAAVLLLATGLGAYGISLWWRHNRQLAPPDWLVALDQAVVVQVVIASLVGLLFAHIYIFLKETETPSWGALLIRAVPLAFLFLIRFFPQELRGLVNQVTRLETDYFVIDLDHQKQEKEVVLIPDAHPEQFETDFQAGSLLLSETVEKTIYDVVNLLLFCDRWLTVIYNLHYLSNKNDTITHRTELVDAFKFTIFFSDLIDNIGKCLRGYSKEFENGVPIQDELSEIAANYAVRRIHGMDGSQVLNQSPGLLYKSYNDNSSPGVTQGFDSSINNIKQHLAAFAVRLKARSSSDESELLSGVCQDIAEAKLIRKHRDAVLDSHIVLPYRSILEAAVLTASGYPVEGARHLEREYGVFVAKFAGVPGENAIEGAPGSGDLMEVMMRMRILSALERTFEDAGNSDDQVRVLRGMVELLGNWLEHVTGVLATTPKTWLEACRDDRLMDKMQIVGDGQVSFIRSLSDNLESDKFLGELRQTSWRKMILEAIQKEETRNEFRDYLGFSYFALTYTRLRLFEALVWDNSQHIREKETKLARQYKELALDESSDGLLRGCFGSEGIEKMRFYIFRAFGLLQAANGTRAPIVYPQIASDEGAARREAVCEAQAALLEAWRVGRDIRQVEPSAIDGDLRDVVRIGTQIKSLRVECGT